MSTTFKLDMKAKYTAVLNVSSLAAKMTMNDFFPLNQAFFLEKPIHPMYEMGLTDQKFDK